MDCIFKIVVYICSVTVGSELKTHKRHFESLLGDALSLLNLTGFLIYTNQHGRIYIIRVKG
jgi:hypothetical protein